MRQSLLRLWKVLSHLDTALDLSFAIKWLVGGGMGVVTTMWARYIGASPVEAMLLGLGCLALVLSVLTAANWYRASRQLAATAQSLAENATRLYSDTLAMKPIPKLDAGTKPISAEERTFVNLSIGEIMKPFREMTTHQATVLFAPLVGKWVQLHAAIRDVDKSERAVTVAFEADGWCVFARFKTSWWDKLNHLRKGQQIKLAGRIEREDMTFLWLADCELCD